MVAKRTINLCCGVVVVTETGMEVLNTVPREIADVEACMAEAYVAY